MDSAIRLFDCGLVTQRITSIPVVMGKAPVAVTGAFLVCFFTKCSTPYGINSYWSRICLV